MDTWTRGESVTFTARSVDEFGSALDLADPVVSILTPSGVTVVDAVAASTGPETGDLSYDWTVPLDADFGAWSLVWDSPDLTDPIRDGFSVALEAPEAGPSPVGPCAPWITSAELSCDLAGFSDAAVARAVSAATEIVWMLSGRRLGNCRTVIRPCQVPNAPHGWHRFGEPWHPVRYEGEWVDVCGGGRCTASAELKLPPGLNLTVDQVVIEGVVLDPTAYQLQGSRLVRLDGGSWPLSQNFGARLGDPGTWSVTVSSGEPVPEVGRMAAAELACELLKAQRGDGDCRLPARITSLSRLGETMTLLDPLEFLRDGRTGLYLVDLFLTATNPKSLAQSPGVFSPDAPGTRRSGGGGSGGGGTGGTGREVELRATDEWVQWRYVGDPLWVNLVALEDLGGAGGGLGGGATVQIDGDGLADVAAAVAAGAASIAVDLSSGTLTTVRLPVASHTSPPVFTLALLGTPRLTLAEVEALAWIDADGDPVDVHVGQYDQVEPADVWQMMAIGTEGLGGPPDTFLWLASPVHYDPATIVAEASFAVVSDAYNGTGTGYTTLVVDPDAPGGGGIPAGFAESGTLTPADFYTAIGSSPVLVFAPGIGTYTVSRGPSSPDTVWDFASVSFLAFYGHLFWSGNRLSSQGGGGTLSDADPEALGTAGPGTGTEAARDDHVHPMPTASDVGADPAGTAASAISALGLGTAAQADTGDFATAAQGTDARTPTAHKSSHATGGSDALAPSDIGAVPTSRLINGQALSSDLTIAASAKAWCPPVPSAVGPWRRTVTTMSMVRGRVYWYAFPILQDPRKVTHVWVDVVTGVASCNATGAIVSAASPTLDAPGAVLASTAVDAISLATSAATSGAALSAPYTLAADTRYFIAVLALGGASDPTCRGIEGMMGIPMMQTQVSAPVTPSTSGGNSGVFSRPSQTSILDNPAHGTGYAIATSAPAIYVSLEAP